ncbi:MAG: uroporphyrinogen-III synthase [Pseudomonadota bacterium]
MADLKSVLVLTRPETQSLSFMEDLNRELGYEVPAIIAPVLRIDRVPFTVEFSSYRTIIISSRNALTDLVGRLSGLNVRTIGEATAAAARDLGAQAVCLGVDIEDFLTRADQVEPPALHLHGRHTRGDLVGRLRESGISAKGCIVYDQVSQQLAPNACAALAQGTAIVPVFSPRSAALVAAHPVHADTRVLAISEAAASAWNAPGRVTVALRPDRAAMVELVVYTVSSGHLVAPTQRR